jgi:hypothetical protein
MFGISSTDLYGCCVLRERYYALICMRKKKKDPKISPTTYYIVDTN